MSAIAPAAKPTAARIVTSACFMSVSSCVVSLAAGSREPLLRFDPDAEEAIRVVLFLDDRDSFGVVDRERRLLGHAHTKPLTYSPNLTLKNWLCEPEEGVTLIVVLTALVFSSIATPLVIGEAVASPSMVSAA